MQRLRDKSDARKFEEQQKGQWAGMKWEGEKWEMRLEREMYVGHGQQKLTVLGLNLIWSGVILLSVVTQGSFAQILKDDICIILRKENHTYICQQSDFLGIASTSENIKSKTKAPTQTFFF